VEWLNILIVILEYRSTFAVITEIVGTNLRIFHYSESLMAYLPRIRREIQDNNLKIYRANTSENFRVPAICCSSHFLYFYFLTFTYVYISETKDVKEKSFFKSIRNGNNTT